MCKETKLESCRGGELCQVLEGVRILCFSREDLHKNILVAKIQRNQPNID